MIKILFLAANPTDTNRLRLDEETRSIDAALRQAEFRDRFDIRQHWAVRISDLQELLLRHRPDIVHFSSHGSNASEIILQDINGESKAVPADALSNLFRILKDNIGCVVLNTGYSEEQGAAIAEHIDCVIGMSDNITDKAAGIFASAFYRGLGFGRSLKTAFELGCLNLELMNLPEQNVPQLIAERIDPATIVYTSLAENNLTRVDVAPAFDNWSEDLKYYFSSLHHNLASLRILGKSESVSLLEIYTDLYFLSKPTSQHRNSINSLKEQPAFSIIQTANLKWMDGLELVREGNNLFILGKPGAGKTVFLRYIVIQAVIGNLDKIPIFCNTARVGNVKSRRFSVIYH
ncbi:hypothetical protein KFU94_41770 [Chloroflexi bacterium TSY]|nr:hypothetical protein [Chloroflexi bacterium TSY]